jgi:Fe2+ or Zn2+ uptake regulation protein
MRSRGLRVTPTRMWVMRLLTIDPHPMSHADLVEKLPREMDRTTVFRALVTLSEVRLLHRVDVGDRVWRYTRSVIDSPDTPQTAFVCTQCGSVQELREARLEVLGSPRALRKGAVRIFVHGYCDACGS